MKFGFAAASRFTEPASTDSECWTVFPGNFHHHYKRHHKHNGESDEHERGQLKTDKGRGHPDGNEDKEPSDRPHF